MQCGKCKGLMVRERFSDYFLIVYAWKCINCGAIVDPTITHNQKKRPVEDPPGSVPHKPAALPSVFACITGRSFSHVSPPLTRCSSRCQAVSSAGQTTAS